MTSSNVPRPLRGVGIAFIVTGLMSMAFMSFMKSGCSLAGVVAVLGKKVDKIMVLLVDCCWWYRQ